MPDVLIRRQTKDMVTEWGLALFHVKIMSMFASESGSCFPAHKSYLGIGKEVRASQDTTNATLLHIHMRTEKTQIGLRIRAV